MIIESLLAITLATAPQPAKPRFDRIDWALLASDASMRALDTYSTRRAINQGDYEKFLPDAISHHTPAMAAYSGAVVAADYFVARQLVKHHHPRLAKIALIADGGQDGYWAVRNLFQKRPAWMVKK